MTKQLEPGEIIPVKQFQWKSIKNLAQKILDVTAEIKPVEKDGVNSFHKYNYVSDAQVISAVRGALVKHKLSVIPSQVSCKQKDGLTRLEVNYNLIDTDSGESMVVTSYGQGMDKGDKGVYKAATGAEKYFFMKTFLIPTQDDPEADVNTDQIASRPDYDDIHVTPKAAPRGASKGNGKAPSAKQIGLVMFKLKSIGITKEADVKAFLKQACGYETLDSWKYIDPVLKAIDNHGQQEEPPLPDEDDAPF